MSRALPIVVGVVMAVYALIDCFQTDRARIRVLSRPIWLAIIVIVPVLGPVLWLTIAKTRSPRARRRPVVPPVAPDDDPEFLRQLRDIDTEHTKMLGDWESDLRRREEELRRRGEGDDEPRP
ncbi:MAG TPA: PLD nuclease N-terminal domain-containing protein [Jiangellaceae bacterium]